MKEAVAAYAAALAPIIEMYGDRPVQSVGKADVAKLVVELRDGTGPHGKWARTSINPMLARCPLLWPTPPTKTVREAEHAHLRELFVHLALLGLRRGELAGLAATQSEPAPAAEPATVLTVDEAADRLKVSRSLIYSKPRSGELRSIRLGRRRLERLPRGREDVQDCAG